MELKVFMRLVDKITTDKRAHKLYTQNLELLQQQRNKGLISESDHHTQVYLVTQQCADRVDFHASQEKTRKALEHTFFM